MPRHRHARARALCVGAVLLAASSAAAVTLTRGPYLQLLDTHSVTVVWNTSAPAACSLAIRHLDCWPCLGNHDVVTAGGQPWRDAFYPPANNPAGTENYYSFDFGNAHVAVIDSNASTSPSGAQYRWLDDDLVASTARWKFVAF